MTLSPKARSALIFVLREDWAAPDLPDDDEAIGELWRIAGIVEPLMGAEALRLWLRSPSPLLDGRAPLDALMARDFGAVLEAVRKLANWS